MAQSNFDRRYKLHITNPRAIENTAENFIKAKDPIQSGFTTFVSDSVTDGGYVILENNTYTITDLQMQATISSDADVSGSKGVSTVIKIYNLSQDTRNKAVAKNNKVVLRAGYRDQDERDELPVVFVGQVTNSFTKREGHDIITYLECNDGATPKNAIRLPLFLQIGTYGDVIREMVTVWNANGVPSGEIITDMSPTKGELVVGSPDLTPLGKGFNHTGYLRSAMDTVCQMFNYEWQIVNGKLYVHPKYGDSFVSTVNLTEELIISIDTNQDGDKEQSTVKGLQGVKINTLLDGRITTKHNVYVPYGEFHAHYKVTKVVHTLDFEGQAWNTELTCVGGA